MMTFLRVVLVLLALPISAVALEIENRTLVPSVGRSPAEAGLESGRYQEIPIEKIAEWEKKQDAKQSASGSVQKNSKVQQTDEQDFLEKAASH